MEGKMKLVTVVVDLNSETSELPPETELEGCIIELVLLM